MDEQTGRFRQKKIYRFTGKNISITYLSPGQFTFSSFLLLLLAPLGLEMKQFLFQIVRERPGK